MFCVAYVVFSWHWNLVPAKISLRKFVLFLKSHLGYIDVSSEIDEGMQDYGRASLLDERIRNGLRGDFYGFFFFFVSLSFLAKQCSYMKYKTSPFHKNIHLIKVNEQ